MTTTAKDLIELGDKLFEKRNGRLLSMWQEIAENFYVERADFALGRTPGDVYADGLMTSYPLLIRRELGDAFAAMLRPTQKRWFHVKTQREDKEDEPARAWLEFAEGVQWRAMYDPVAQFSRATKGGDHDFATFGMAVLSTELNRKKNALLFRNWHIRDVVWCENLEGRADTFHRKWKPWARDALKQFPGKLHPNLVRKAEEKAYEEVEIRHIVMPAEDYEGPSSARGDTYGANATVMSGSRRWKTPYVSIYIDVENQEVIEEVGVYTAIYRAPIWAHLPGLQYGYSPAVTIALPEARLLQAMTTTLLEASEKATNPPMLMVGEALRSDVNVFAGGLTSIDAEYDEKTGEALRPMTIDTRGLPIGIDMMKDCRDLLSKIFYLNTLSMPPAGTNPEMTAFEVGQRVQEYIRNALPLFEPMEAEYNGGLCEDAFDLLQRGGAFGSPLDMPRSLLDANIKFGFESPLNEAIERQVATKLQESKAMLALVADLDPGAARMLDAATALRETFKGIGTPATWIRTKDALDQMAKAEAAKQQAAELLGTMQQGADAAKGIGDAALSLRQGLGDPAQANPQGAALAA